MEQNAFTGGVRPGGLTNSYEVNILICYLLSHAQAPLSFAQLSEATQWDGLVNYFELAQAVDRLEQDGHIVRSDAGGGRMVFRLTPSGKTASETFAHQLPRSVRERSVAAAKQALQRERREKEILTEIEKMPDGYKMTLRMTDIGTDLLGVSLFLPTAEDCRRVEQRFRSDPEQIYKSLLALLTGDSGIADDAPDGEPQ